MALSTTQYGYIIDPMVPFTDDKGKTIKNGFVRVFVAGSSTPVVTYRNFDGAANQDLIELDNSGRTKTNVIGSKGLTYKVCVYDQLHSQESPILTVDKVSVIGANIMAGAGATVVTGLDGLTTKPDGFVDASVVGTDGYVALDHTLVTDDLNTDAKVTAVENDRYVPLLNDDVNDPDSKMTLGRLWQWVLGHIKSIATSISTFRDGDYLFVDGSAGMAKMSKDDFLALIGNSQEIYQRLKEAMLRVDEIAGGIKPRIFGTNWFNQTNLLHGKWVSYENGTINDNPDYSCTQLTPIEESATYHAKNSVNGDQIAFYDINLDFIGGVLLSLQSDTEFHTPAGARFARYCTATTNLTPFYIVKDSSIMWKDPYHFRGWYEGDEIIVAKDGSGYFTTLTEAASYAVDGDVIHVKAGVYDNEAVQLFGKTVTVYGDGCLNTIVKNGWNTYSKAPIEMTTGVLRDIQFYAYDGGSPSQDPSGATAYALHVDSDTSYGKPFLVERCIFISEKGNNAVGVGIYGGCDFIFRDCQFIGGVSSPFYVHDSTNTQYVGVMDLELYNNTFVSFGNGCFGIDAARLNGTTVYLTACGNNFHDNGTPVGLPHLFTGEVLYPPDDQPGPATGNTNIGVVNWNTKPLNNGNNLPIFNGGYQYATKGADWIDHGQFGTARIADDAITAAKVKDNETLPVNISGSSNYVLPFIINKEMQTTNVWAKVATASVSAWYGYSITFQAGFSGYGGTVDYVAEISVGYKTVGGGAYGDYTLFIYRRNYSSTAILDSKLVRNGNTLELWVKDGITDTALFLVPVYHQGFLPNYADSNDRSKQLTDSAFTTYIADKTKYDAAVRTTAYIPGFSQVGSTAIPVYVDSNGQVQPCDTSQFAIADGAVTTAKIADDAITAAKVKDNETLPVNVSGAALRSRTMFEGGSNINGNAVYSFGVQNTNNVLTGWRTIAVIKNDSGDYSFSSARFIGRIYSSGGNWGQFTEFEIRFQVICDFNSSLYRICHTPSSNVKNLLRLVEVSARGTYELQVAPQGISSYSNFYVYVYTDNGNKVNIEWKDDLNTVGSAGTALDNYEIDIRMFKLANGQVGSPSNPVYVDSDGQVQPCDLAQLKAALAAV